MPDKKLSDLPVIANSIIDTDLFYMARQTGSGFESVKVPAKNLFAIGSHGIPGSITLAPGDPVHAEVFTANFGLVFNDFIAADFNATVSHGGIAIYPGLKHTGATPAQFASGIELQPSLNSDSGQVFVFTSFGSYPTINTTQNIAFVAGVDSEPFVNSSATIDGVVAVYAQPNAYGDFSGNVTFWEAVEAQVFIPPAGSITNAYSVQIDTPHGTPNRATNVIGLNIDDQSGWGSAISNNIRSRGINSINKFEGNLDVDGMTALGSFGVIGETNFRPGDPGAPVNHISISDYTLLLDDAHVVDVASFGFGNSSAFIVYDSWKHTGTAGAHLYAIDVEPVIRSDSTGPINTFVGAGIWPATFSNQNMTFFAALDSECFPAVPAGTTINGAMGIYAAANSIANSFRGRCDFYEAIQCQVFIPDAGSVGSTAGIRVVSTDPGAGSPRVIPDAVYGIIIEDQSGIAAATNYNLKSEGLWSTNLFEGGIKVSRGIPITNTVDVSGKNFTGVDVLETAEGTGILGDIVGMRSYVVHNANAISTGEVTGIQAFAQITRSGGSCLELNGVRARLNWAAGVNVFQNARTFWAGRPQTSVNNVVNNFYGVLIDDHSGLATGDSLNIMSKGLQSGNSFEGAVRSVPRTFANRPTPAAQGMIAEFTDSTVNTFGAVIAGGGANKVLGHYNGTNWTVMAI